MKKKLTITASIAAFLIAASSFFLPSSPEEKESESQKRIRLRDLREKEIAAENGIHKKETVRGGFGRAGGLSGG